MDAGLGDGDTDVPILGIDQHLTVDRSGLDNESPTAVLCLVSEGRTPIAR